MIQARVVFVKNDLEDLMMALMNAEVKAEDIPLHIHQGHTKNKEYKCEKTMVVVNSGHINKTTTL